MRWTTAVTLGVLMIVTIVMARRRQRRVMSEEWMRDQLYPKDGY